jgi:hypothetical protein
MIEGCALSHRNGLLRSRVLLDAQRPDRRGVRRLVRRERISLHQRARDIVQPFEEAWREKSSSSNAHAPPSDRDFPANSVKLQGGVILRFAAFASFIC